MDTETKLDQINRWMMLAANIGVLLGILFLVFELRQNTVASRAEAASNYQDSFSEIELFIARDAEFAALLEAGRNGDDLSSVDQFRLTVFYGNVLRTWQNAHFQHEAGSLNRDLWLSIRSRFATILTEDRGLSEHWVNHQSEFTPAFNKLVSQLVETDGAS